jgi:serine/threonine protein kinase
MEHALTMASNFDQIRKLGSGHFGEVWLAVDTGLNVERALKLIPVSKVLNPANFFHEAQILKTAEHANVVKVEDTGKMADGRIYVAMEYIKRGSLEDESKGSNIYLTRAKRIMIDVLRGLQHAHENEILHRDIKPANILIGDNFEGKLSDFGQAVSSSLDLKKLGVKDYAYILHMAPEVFEGRNYSIYSDIYACGMTLYRLVNGDSYLPALQPNEIKDACLSAKFPNRSLYRDFIPQNIKRLINKALNLDPSKRFSSAQEMRRALEHLKIEMNWQEIKLQNGIQWRCGWGHRCYEVTRLQEPDSRWSIITKKGSSKKSLRRTLALCKYSISKSEAIQFSKRILKDFVLGRLN